MSYYTIIPKIRDVNDIGYIDNFCQGAWKVLNGNTWLQLTPYNTRVRDKNNLAWIEVCDGHKLEDDTQTIGEKRLDCACYSKGFNTALNRDLNVFATEASGQSTTDFILYGSLIGVCDFEPYVYLPYFAKKSDGFEIRMYCINKSTATIDNITIDRCKDMFDANVYVEENEVIICGNTLKYSIGYDYVINANFEQNDVHKLKSIVRGVEVLVTDKIYVNGEALKDANEYAQYSTLLFEDTLCVCEYYNSKIVIIDLEGNQKGTSISDAKRVYFFDRYSNLISVEAHDNYIHIKGVE